MGPRVVVLTGALFLCVAGVSPVLAQESAPSWTNAAPSSPSSELGADRAGVGLGVGWFSPGRFSRLVENEYVVTPLGVVNDLYSSTCVIGDRMLFMVTGREALWVTDGTVAGTHLVNELDGYSHLGCSVVDDQLFFTVAKTAAFGSETELWITDSTAEGTTLVRDFGPESRIWNLFAVSEFVILVVATPTEGAVLWVSDGTVAGTRWVAVLSEDEASRPELQAAFNDHVVIRLGGEVWITDGTDGGTRRLADLAPADELDNPGGWVVFGDEVLFTADSGLWVTDGTVTGTELLRDQLRMGGGVLVDGDQLFAGRIEATGAGLWITDGTPEGTKLVHVVEPIGHFVSFPRGDRAAFVASSESDQQYELWVSDGTAAGTRLMTRIASNGLQEVAVVGERLVLGFSVPVTFAEVWVSDGTPDGTHRLPGLFPNAGPRTFGCQYPHGSFGFTPLGDRLLFAGNDTASGLAGWWVTDGTVEGTDFVTQAASPTQLVRLGTSVLYVADGCGLNPEFHVIARNKGAMAPVDDYADATNLASLVNAANYSSASDAPVLRLYRAYFDREPDLDGAKYWLTVRRRGYRLLEIAGFMAGSQEFKDNYAEVSDVEYLRRVYQNMLGRHYDQAGFGYWLDLLQAQNASGLNPDLKQLTRSGVVFYVSRSQEFITSYPYTK